MIRSIRTVGDRLVTPALHLSVDPLRGHMVARPLGALRRQLRHQPTTVENLDLLLASDGARVGFALRRYQTFPLDGEDPRLWTDALYVVPAIHHRPQSVGEIVLGARACFGLVGTPDVTLALEAQATEMGGDVEAALALWRQSLAAGNIEAHRGIGQALLVLHAPEQARHHLLASAEQAPTDPARWMALSTACEAAGDAEAARRGYRRALQESRDPSVVTEISQRLAALGLPTRLWEEAWAPTARRDP